MNGANETIEYKKGHKNSRGEDAPWVILDHKNGKVLVSFSKKDDAEAHLERMKHYSKGEKLFNKQELESMAMNGYKAAVTAAWSDAGVKNFKIDIRANEEEPPALDVYPKALDGKDIDVSWRLLPNAMKIVQYSISPAGNHTIERELDFATEDDVEIIFTDEFKSVDDVLEHGIGSYDSPTNFPKTICIKEQAMGIKLIKKESMERCDSCGAVMTEYEYDRYGGLCKYCRDKGKAKKPEARPSYYDHSLIMAITYKGSTIYCGTEDGDMWSNDIEDAYVWNSFDAISTIAVENFVAVAKEALETRWISEDNVEYLPAPIGTDEVKKPEDASSVDDLLARHNQKWLVKISYDVDASHSAVAPSIVRADTKDAAMNIALKRHRGLGHNMKVISVEPMTESRKKSETAPDEYARNNFLEGALDYAEIEDDEGNVVLLKITKRYANEIGGDFCLRSYDGETDKSLAMGGIRYVVGRYGELIDMDPAEAIIEIAKE